jgi:hypothetical protein
MPDLEILFRSRKSSMIRNIKSPTGRVVGLGDEPTNASEQASQHLLYHPTTIAHVVSRGWHVPGYVGHNGNPVQADITSQPEAH